MRYSSKDCVLLVDGFNVLGVNTELSETREAVTEESTPFGAEWETHKYVGIQRTELTQTGFYDDASESINEALNEKQGETRILCLGFASDAVGKSFTGFEGNLQTKYERVASRGELHKASAEYIGSGVVEDGRILHPIMARTADGDTRLTPVQHGGTSTNGAAYLQVVNLTLGGYTDATIRILERNGGTWDTLDEFSAVSLLGAERIEISGTIQQDLAVEWKFNGAGASPSIEFFVGFVRY